MKIAVIGDAHFIIGFQLAGVKDAFEVNNKEDFKKVIEKVRNMNDLAIVIIQRDKVYEFRRMIDEWKREKSIYPVILELPGLKEKEVYEDPMREIIKRAIGIDVLKR
jgi:V/A-type H+-transporting ATPase subunit F